MNRSHVAGQQDAEGMDETRAPKPLNDVALAGAPCLSHRFEKIINKGGFTGEEIHSRLVILESYGTVENLPRTFQ